MLVKYASTGEESTTYKISTGYGAASLEDISAQLDLSAEEAEKFIRRADKPLVLYPERYLYIRNRAVSSLEEFGANDNRDAFPFEELQNWYHTFVRAGVFLNHDNQDWNKRVGLVYDSVLKKSPTPKLAAWPKGSGWVENLLIIDIPRAEGIFPGIITLLAENIINQTSMGCLAKYSACSICGKKIYTLKDYCPHLANKTMRLMSGTLPPTHFEIVYQPLFFEDSIITTGGNTGIEGGGADHNAITLSKYASALPEYRETRRMVKNIINKYSSNEEVLNKPFFDLGKEHSMYKDKSTYLSSLAEAEVDEGSLAGSSSQTIVPVLEDISRLDKHLAVANNLIKTTNLLVAAALEKEAAGGTGGEGWSGHGIDVTDTESMWSFQPPGNKQMTLEEQQRRLKVRPPETEELLKTKIPFKRFNIDPDDFTSGFGEANSGQIPPTVFKVDVPVDEEAVEDIITQEDELRLLDTYLPEKWKKWQK